MRKSLPHALASLAAYTGSKEVRVHANRQGNLLARPGAPERVKKGDKYAERVRFARWAHAFNALAASYGGKHLTGMTGPEQNKAIINNYLKDNEEFVGERCKLIKSHRVQSVSSLMKGDPHANNS